MALYTVSALLPDPTICKQPKHCLKQQRFVHLQNVGSGNNALKDFTVLYPGGNGNIDMCTNF